MKEKLIRLQPMKKISFNKASLFQSIIIFIKMGQSSSIKPQTDTGPLDILLTNKAHNLCQIRWFPLRARPDHFHHIIMNEGGIILDLFFSF